MHGVHETGGDVLGLILEAWIGAYPGWMVEIDYRFLVSKVRFNGKQGDQDQYCKDYSDIKTWALYTCVGRV